MRHLVIRLVQADDQATSAVPGDLSRHRISSVPLAQVGHRDMGADVARAAGNQRGASIKVHRYPLPRQGAHSRSHVGGADVILLRYRFTG
jgi:hypothetical protein